MQEPSANLDDALLIARRFEAANATMQTLVGQGPSTSNTGMIGTVSSRNKTVTRLHAMDLDMLLSNALQETFQ